MATTVSMPQLGETVTEGTILSWPKGVGETIAVDEVLVEISTDKVDTEIPSPVGGTILEILVPEGETVVVGTDMIVIGEAGEQPDAPAAEEPVAEEPGAQVVEAPVVAEAPTVAVAEPPPVAAVERSDVDPLEGMFLSPVVRKLAREHNLDLSSIVGTGRDGRITRKDVEALIETGVPATPVEPPAAATPAEPPAAGTAG